MVGQGKSEIGAQLVGQLIANVVRAGDGELHHILRQIVDRAEVPLVNVVERALDLGKHKLARQLAKADAFAHGEELVAGVVPAHGHVVVDAADCLHAVPFPAFPGASFRTRFIRSLETKTL